VASAATLYGIAAFTGDVYRIDTDNPSIPVLEFSLGSGKDFAGLTYSEQRKTYFAYSRAQNKIYEFNQCGNIIRIITVDRPLTSGFGGPRGIAFDAAGNLLVVGFDNDVYRVDLLTGATTFLFRAVGPTSQVESIAGLDTEALLAVGTPSQLFILDRTNGQLSTVEMLPAGDLDAMTGTIGGTVFMAESGSTSQLHAYNPFTQTYAALGWVNIPHLSSLEEYIEPTLILPVVGTIPTRCIR
jgi:hypothetical protein